MKCATCYEELPERGIVLDQHGWRHADCPDVDPKWEADLGHPGCAICEAVRAREVVS